MTVCNDVDQQHTSQDGSIEYLQLKNQALWRENGDHKIRHQNWVASALSLFLSRGVQIGCCLSHCILLKFLSSYLVFLDFLEDGVMKTWTWDLLPQGSETYHLRPLASRFWDISFEITLVDEFTKLLTIWFWMVSFSNCYEDYLPFGILTLLHNI